MASRLLRHGTDPSGNLADLIDMLTIDDKPGGES